MKLNNYILPSNKKFGYFFSFIFLILASYFLYSSNKIIGYLLIITALIFFVITIIKPSLLLPLNKMWMYLGFILGKIISPIVLGIIFFGLFTPYGIAMRMMGRDELYLKKTKKQSHWIHRSDSSLKTNFKRQF